MKKKGLTLAALLLISGLTTTIMTSCDDDTNSYLRVNVVDGRNGRPMPGAVVTVNADGGTVKRSGKTDGGGIFDATFACPGVFNISAEYKIDSLSNSQKTAYRNGASSARLKDGDTSYVTISIPAEIKYR